MRVGVGVVPDFEIEMRQIAKLLAGQVQARVLRHAALIDPRKVAQCFKKGLPIGQRDSWKKSTKNLGKRM